MDRLCFVESFSDEEDNDKPNMGEAMVLPEKRKVEVQIDQTNKRKAHKLDKIIAANEAFDDVCVITSSKAKGRVLEAAAAVAVVQPNEAVSVSPTSTTSSQEQISEVTSMHTSPEKQPTRAAPTSSYLSSFLRQKRQSTVPEPPQAELADPMFLAEFFKGLPPTVRDETDIEESHNTEELTNSVTVDKPIVPVEEDKEILAKLRVFNLPYRLIPEEFTKIAMEYAPEWINNLSFVKIKVDMDTKKNLPAGSMSIWVAESNTVEIMDGLEGMECNGRRIRVENLSAKKKDPSKRLSLDKGRYFGSGNISVKCSNCGEVGHMQQQCTNASLPTPCHLCAGQDHDAGKCPNITCFRCGQFGHHSKVCTLPKMSSVVVCSRCGSNTHDTKQCNASADEKAIENDGCIRCMMCNALGHAICKPIGKLPHRNEIYCPNCGEQGHHIDYPRREGGSECVKPKNDAYNRFPQLLDMLDDDAVPNDLYQSLIRSVYFDPSGQVKLLFPSLYGSHGHRSDHNRRASFPSNDHFNHHREVGRPSQPSHLSPSQPFHPPSCHRDHRNYNYYDRNDRYSQDNYRNDFGIVQPYDTGNGHQGSRPSSTDSNWRDLLQNQRSNHKGHRNALHRNSNNGQRHRQEPSQGQGLLLRRGI